MDYNKQTRVQGSWVTPSWSLFTKERHGFLRSRSGSSGCLERFVFLAFSMCRNGLSWRGGVAPLPRNMSARRHFIL